ncbi:MAG TPA: 4Fe-4S binding protein [Methylomusa anaerophila]|uniref:Quinol dehydrogenase membrane component n=1 Tax=Methylomusa anaerophila TaxID=1930071 RepID=A0A348AF05_9FIRM|nr:4Fe-4S binding protein [Methylomusa anaerophila]BBB89653.1 quinol dehydrogenase membrane component [Methylomusa anaerophila]HML89571.1 4Fe-4S binding protein [Methylomusa anaerophila]
MRKRIRPYLFWILLAFLGVGLVYPAIGIIALTCMIAPVAVAPFRGRYWCGNYCPRGSFYDHVLAKLSPKRKIPAPFSHTAFRAFMVLFIISVFTVQMVYAWEDWAAVGRVFVQIILITTIVGVVLGLVYHQRAWCSFCPMGTLASWISQRKKSFPLIVENSCINCKLCTKACPMQLAPYTAKGSTEGFSHSDCLKCDRCVERCPKQALQFNRNAK